MDGLKFLFLFFLHLPHLLTKFSNIIGANKRIPIFISISKSLALWRFDHYWSRWSCRFHSGASFDAVVIWDCRLINNCDVKIELIFWTDSVIHFDIVHLGSSKQQGTTGIPISSRSLIFLEFLRIELIEFGTHWLLIKPELWRLGLLLLIFLILLFLWLLLLFSSMSFLQYFYLGFAYHLDLRLGFCLRCMISLEIPSSIRRH